MTAASNDEIEKKAKLLPNEIIVVVIDKPGSVFVTSVIYTKDNTINTGTVNG